MTWRWLLAKCWRYSDMNINTQNIIENKKTGEWDKKKMIHLITILAIITNNSYEDEIEEMAVKHNLNATEKYCLYQIKGMILREDLYNCALSQRLMNAITINQCV